MSPGKADTAKGLRALRGENARRILRTLLDNPGGLTQQEIAAISNLARSTVSMVFSETLGGVLTSSERGRNDRGPRPRFWSIDRSAAYVVGVDIGQTHISVLLANPYGETVSGPFNVHKRTRSDPEGVLNEARTVIERTIQSTDRCRRIAAVMVGLPGVTDSERGFLADPTSPDWNEKDVPRSVRSRWPLAPPPPVYVENDANLGALGEFYKGAGRGAKSLLFIKWSTGIGSGLILNGQLWRGKSGGAGELGHLAVNPTQADREALRLPPPDQMPACPRCEQTHCIERIASGGALAKTLGVEDFNGVLRLAKEAEPRRKEAAQAALDAAAQLIGTAIGPVLTMLNVERVIVGGVGGKDAYPLVVRSIRRGLDQTAPPKARTDAEIKASELSDRAYVTGAVISALEKNGINFLYQRATGAFAEPVSTFAEGALLPS